MVLLLQNSQECKARYENVTDGWRYLDRLAKPDIHQGHSITIEDCRATYVGLLREGFTAVKAGFNVVEETKVILAFLPAQENLPAVHE